MSEEKKVGAFGKIKEFFVDCKIELKKIVWPTPKMVFKNTGIVLITIFIMGIFVALLDTGLLYGLGKIMSVSSRSTSNAQMPGMTSQDIFEASEMPPPEPTNVATPE